jgi:hypothetical protein
MSITIEALHLITGKVVPVEDCAPGFTPLSNGFYPLWIQRKSFREDKGMLKSTSSPKNGRE